MFAVCVAFHIRPDNRDQFLVRMRQQASESLALEDGCHRFDVCSGGDQSNVVFLYELYTDAAAFDHHCESAHFLAFSEDVAAFVERKEVQTYSVVYEAA